PPPPRPLRRQRHPRRRARPGLLRRGRGPRRDGRAQRRRGRRRLPRRRAGPARPGAALLPAARAGEGAMTPAVVRAVAALRRGARDAGAAGRAAARVRTWGAPPAGHTGLIDRARAEKGGVVVSVFVTPTQFGPREDLARSPRPLERALELCARHGVGVVFA